METSANYYPSETQLLSEIRRYKERIIEMEELYSEEDEKNYQKIQNLEQQKKELEEKVENLQNRLYNVEFYLSTSSYSSPLHSTKYDHDTTATDTSFTTSIPNFDDSTLSEDFADLQDSFHSLSEEKSELEIKVDKLNDHIKELQEIIEDLCFKNYTQEEMIQKMKCLNFELCQKNKDLYKTVINLQNEIEGLQSCNTLNETQMSLFDEIEEVKKKEEQLFQQNKAEQDLIPEIIVVQNTDMISSTSPNQSLQVYENCNLQISKKKFRISFIKKSLIRFISVVAVCFDYLAAGVPHEFPVVVNFLSNDLFSFQNRPRVP